MGKDVAISAPTGISAFNISGLTIHRLLQLPVEHGHSSSYRELSDEALKIIRKELRHTVLFVFDEISMVSNVTFIYINLRLSEIFATSDIEDGWFGKKHILLFGDLLQLPPVHEQSPFVKLTPADVAKHLGSLSAINLWTELLTYDELLINMRHGNDPDFENMLKRIRVGMVSQDDLKMLETRKVPLTCETIPGRLREIADYITKLPYDAVCLLPTRRQCAVLNRVMLSSISSEEIKLYARDSVDCATSLRKKATKLLAKYEEDSSQTVGLEKVITVKIGAKIILRRNIDVTNGLVNGALGCLISLKRSLDDPDIVESLTIRLANDEERELWPVETKFEVMEKAYVFRKQFPISLAYGITIHKSQGLSLKNAILDIGHSVFTCGQAYVALSRVTTLAGVHLLNLDPTQIRAQQSAIAEYNRLRHMHRPDLLPFPEGLRSVVNQVGDRIWMNHEGVEQVQKMESIALATSIVQGRKIRGFQNKESVYCYSNAVVQCLYHCEEIRLQFMASPLFQDQYLNYETDDFVNTERFCSIAAQVFLNQQQQDCVDFLEALANSFPALRKALQFEDKTSIHCLNCGHISILREEDIVLRVTLPLETAPLITNLHRLFRNTKGRPEPVSDIYCEGCEQMTSVEMRTEIEKPGNYLVLQLKIFNRNGKITNLKVRSVPTTRLDIGGNVYTPLSAIFHHGDTATSGHYTSYLKSGREWMCANDLEVSRKRWPVNAKDLYVIFLKKC